MSSIIPHLYPTTHSSPSPFYPSNHSSLPLLPSPLLFSPIPLCSVAAIHLTLQSTARRRGATRYAPANCLSFLPSVRLFYVSIWCMLLSLISTLSISPCLSLPLILIPGPHRQAGQESRLLPQVCGEYWCSLSVFLSLSFYFPFTRTLYFYSPLHLASLPLPLSLILPPSSCFLLPLSLPHFPFLSQPPSSLTPLFPPFLSYPSLIPSSSCYALSGLAIAQSSNISTVPPHTGTRMGSGHSSESSSTLPQVCCVLYVVCCMCHMALCCVLRPCSLLFSLDLLLTLVLFYPLFSSSISCSRVSHTALSRSSSPASPPLLSSHMILTLNHSPSLTSAARKIYSVLSYLTPCYIP